jgi:hypothetical protein
MIVDSQVEEDDIDMDMAMTRNRCRGTMDGLRTSL